MVTYDLDEIRKFADDLDAKMRDCDNQEGMECANLDDTLRFYATLCSGYYNEVRQWARAVFTGRTPFNDEAVSVFRAKGTRLYARTVDLLTHSKAREGEGCYQLDGQGPLIEALLALHHLLHGWVRPQLAVSPSARQGMQLSPADAEKVRQHLESLPPLPADWEPTDPEQRERFRRLKRQPTA